MAKKSSAELAAERAKRIQDAYDMKVPDRVPIVLNLGYMLAKLGGITKYELENNPDKAQELLEKWAVYFDADSVSGMGLFTSAPSVMLKDRQTKWPGFGLGPDQAFQFVEGEYMKPEEYDEFLEDPTNFTLRKFMPRVYGALEGFALLPRIPIMLIGYAALGTVATLNVPAIRSAVETLLKLADWYAESMVKMQTYAKRMEALGFPSGPGLGVLIMAPFDFMCDTLRGMRGIFLDMYRRPDKLLASLEKAKRIVVDYAVQTCRAMGGRFVIIPLHRGSDGFMSIEQFETFYWPSLKATMLELIDAGLKPMPFYEGVWDQRLHYLAELPKGKTAGMFQNSNMFKVKEVLGDVMTIVGGFPVSLLQGGTPDQIRELTKKMCQVCGKNGGFIMGANTAMDECEPELVKVWVDATKEYGVY